VEISAGVLITDDRNLFIVHPTGKNYWDIPKGRIEFFYDESAKDAALRELLEETGVNIYKEHDLITLGLYKYIPNKKDLYLFLVRDKNCIKKVLSCKLQCTSFFELHDKEYPENDKWKFINLKDRYKYLTIRMNEVLDQIFINQER
jgi:8-oxo-dGTP pyrophosphatase MutT (NUDIX family)